MVSHYLCVYSYLCVFGDWASKSTGLSWKYTVNIKVWGGEERTDLDRGKIWSWQSFVPHSQPPEGWIQRDRQRLCLHVSIRWLGEPSNSPRNMTCIPRISQQKGNVGEEKHRNGWRRMPSLPRRPHAASQSITFCVCLFFFLTLRLSDCIIVYFSKCLCVCLCSMTVCSISFDDAFTSTERSGLFSKLQPVVASSCNYSGLDWEWIWN